MIELGQTIRIQIKIITEYQGKLDSKPALCKIHRYVQGCVLVHWVEINESENIWFREMLQRILSVHNNCECLFDLALQQSFTGYRDNSSILLLFLELGTLSITSV